MDTLSRLAPALISIPVAIAAIVCAHALSPVYAVIADWGLGLCRCLLYFSGCSIDFVITIAALLLRIMGGLITVLLEGVPIAIALWPLWLSVSVAIAAVEFCAPPHVKAWLASSIPRHVSRGY